MVDEQSSMTVITDVTREDVVLGRGAGPNEHMGNIAFREVVNGFKPFYLAAVNRKVKCEIARNVLKVVKARRGRFLKRAPGHADTEEVYILADDEVALEKAKQALRHGTKGVVSPRVQNFAGSPISPSRQSSSSSTSSLGEVISGGHSVMHLYTQGNESSSGASSPSQSLPEQSFHNINGIPPQGVAGYNFPTAVPAPTVPSIAPQSLPTSVSYPEIVNSSGIEAVLKFLIASEEQRRQELLRATTILSLLQSSASPNGTSTLQASLNSSSPPLTHAYSGGNNLNMLLQNESRRAMATSLNGEATQQLAGQLLSYLQTPPSSEITSEVSKNRATFGHGTTQLPASLSSSLMTHLLAQHGAATMGTTTTPRQHALLSMQPPSSYHPTTAINTLPSAILCALLGLPKPPSSP